MKARFELCSKTITHLAEKWQSTFIFLLLPVLFCAGCVAVGAGVPRGRTVAEGPVSFRYSTALADGMLAHRQPGVTVEQAAGMDYAVMPEHLAFIFLDSYAEGRSLYRQAANLTTTPQILVFETKTFEELSPLAAERIVHLKALLRERSEQPVDQIPLLPMPNGAQMFHVKVAYLNFAGGTGVRFVTQYAQEARHVNNAEVFYTFQGLSSDGRYYVSATFPVMSGILPPANTSKPDGSDAPRFAEESNQAVVVPKLEALRDGDYAPDLSVLDAVIKSIKIH